jgi:hypothetical protein
MTWPSPELELAHNVLPLAPAAPEAEPESMVKIAPPEEVLMALNTVKPDAD